MKMCIAAIFIAITGLLTGAEKPALVVKELGHLVSAEAKSEGDGKVLISQQENDPRILKLDADLVVQSIDGAKGLSEIPVFAQGALVSISGAASLPLKGEKMSIKNDIQAQGPMQIVDGKVIFMGPVKIRGAAYLITDKEAKVIEMVGDSEAPLMFRLSLDGFIYVSGKGRIQMPDGATHSFP